MAKPPKAPSAKPKTPPKPSGPALGAPPPMLGKMPLTFVATNLGLDPKTTTLADVADHLAGRGVPPDQIAPLMADGEALLTWNANSPAPGGPQLQTNVNPSTPASDADVGADPATAATKPGSTKKRRQTIDPEVLRKIVENTVGAAMTGGDLKQITLGTGGVKVAAAFRKPGVAAAAGDEVDAGTAAAGPKPSKGKKGPQPGSKQWADAQDEAARNRYFDKGQVPPASVGIESALNRNMPTIKRVAGAMLGGSMLPIGYYALKGAGVLGGTPQPQQSQKGGGFDPDLAAAEAAHLQEMGLAPQQKPAGTSPAQPPTLDRIQRSRSY